MTGENPDQGYNAGGQGQQQAGNGAGTEVTQYSNLVNAERRHTGQGNKQNADRQLISHRGCLLKKNRILGHYSMMREI